MASLSVFDNDHRFHVVLVATSAFQVNIFSREFRFVVLLEVTLTVKNINSADILVQEHNRF